MQAFDIPRQGIHIHLFAGHADDRHGLRHLTHITTTNGIEEFRHAVPGLTANTPDNTKIDKPDPAILQQHQIASMHIRVEEITQHQAGKPGVQCRDQGLRRVVGIFSEHIHIGQGNPKEALHGQHLAGGVGHDRIRCDCRGIAGITQEGIERLQVVCLLDEVTLFQHAGL